MLATNSEAILAARMKGMKPADMVVVSLVGPVGLDNPTVFAKVGTAYDWRWVRGLDVCVYFDNAQEWPDLVKLIALQRPEHLNLWNQADKWGAKVWLIPNLNDLGKPVKMWKWELDFSPWFDFQNQDFIDCKTYALNNWGMACT